MHYDIVLFETTCTHARHLQYRYSKFIGVRYEFIRITPSVWRRRSETLFDSEVELVCGSDPWSSVEMQVFMKF